MFRKRKELTFKQVFWGSAFLIMIYFLFQRFHWINLIGALFVLLVIIPTVYYFSNGHSFKAISFENKTYFDGVSTFFILITVTIIILITVLISVFAPNLL
ncbi:hypothetical protein GCM10025886_13920 [Tetragenococcus halophilus subsp. flandriensis]|uniref:hypothetical protein n=1 Tax=Tetragenococcus halophilus TaxID=51669 RepID=UPI0023EA3A15|nr:hypothetical protein [Tetragenococcus halophilus]GMA08241.1 hypothetical protein GCM10025886_13920 [Tetragenococcus halophilus subsp. flandriensis]